MDNKQYSFKAIGEVESCFKEKFGIPRQPGLTPSAKARIYFYPPYNNPDAFDGIEQSSHLWLQFVFHQMPVQKFWHPKVRPPRLGGNKSLGVFATRSPNRPNPIGLSVVKNEGLYCDSEALYLEISGVDLLNKTPILDIKPYLPYVDRIPDAYNYVANEPPGSLAVTFTLKTEAFCRQYKSKNTIDLYQLLSEVLGQDPRPRYQKVIPNREYGMLLLNLNVKWTYIQLGSEVQISVTSIIPHDL